MTTQYHLVDKDFKNNIVVDSASAVLVEDGVVWDQAELQMSLNYENADSTLIENNNESYLSTNDDGNGTQYFSLLESTNEHVLNDLNDITLYTDGNNQVQISDQEGVDMICTLEDQQQHNILAESADLYAFQVAYDEDGNVQKYRYMLRLNEDGEYETVPESLELLPEDIELPINEVLPVEEQQTEFENPKIAYRSSDFIIKKEEHEDASHCNGDTYHDIHISEPEEFYKNQMFQENVETKLAGISQNGSVAHKIETSCETSNESSTTFNAANYDQEDSNLVQIKPILNSASNHPIRAELHLNNFEAVYALQETTHENEETSADAFEEEQLIISDDNQQGSDRIVSHDILNEVNGHANTELPEDVNGNDSEEEFQIVDGVHVTADNDGHEDVIPPVEVIASKISGHQVLKLQENMAFLNNTLDDIKIKNALKKNGNKGNKSLLYYVVKDPEKENVVSLSDAKKVMRTNPRSVLKSSFTCFDEKKDNTKPDDQIAKSEKKLVKSKENKGKMLQNYIAKTTIILAPVRQERMPRKQTIKPVKRSDEEIIVQEVVVSSNGFVETKEDGVVKSKTLLAPTDFVQVSDSDEDYNVKAERKKKRKKKKRRSKVAKIVISDTEDDDCDESIVEIDLSVDSDQEQGIEKNRANEVTEQEDNSTLAENVKKRRGRPRKRPSSSLEESGSSSSSKKMKSTNESENSDGTSPKKGEVNNVNTEWECSSCTKVFPSQGSLKTHMQYHTYRKSVNKSNLFKKPLPTVFKPNSYKCAICHEMFKNKYLLMKHTNEHNDSNKFECSSCKKLFSDQVQLTNHRRSHVKEHMFHSTTLPKYLPKSKKLGGSSLNLSQLQEKYKCSFCSKIFTSQTLLNTHSSLHKRFVCLSCQSTFMSKLALEDHMQHSCVKQSRSPTPLKTKPLRNTMCTSSRKVAVKTDISNSNINNIRSPLSSTVEKKTPGSARHLDLKCDKCSVVFKLHKNLYTHKVLQHGLETPDKSISLNKSKTVIRKELANHSSVPAGQKLRNAFANLRTIK